MDGRAPEIKRRRLLEAGIAASLFCILSIVVAGPGTRALHPKPLFGLERGPTLSTIALSQKTPPQQAGAHPDAEAP